MPLYRARLTRSALQNAIDTGPANAKLAGDVGRSDPISLQRRDLSSPCSCSCFPASVFPLRFRFGDAFALPFEHQFALEAGNSSDDGEHQATRRCAGVAEVQDGQVGTFSPHAFGNLQEMLG